MISSREIRSKEIREQAFELKEGDISQPFKVELLERKADGSVGKSGKLAVYILKADKVVNSGIRRLEEVREEIENLIAKEIEANAQRKWLTNVTRGRFLLDDPDYTNINKSFFQYHGDVKVRQENYYKYHCVVDPDKNMTTEPSNGSHTGLNIDNSDNCYTNRNFDIHSKTTQIGIFGYHDGQSRGSYVYTGSGSHVSGFNNRFYDINYWGRRTGEDKRVLYGYSEPSEYLHHHFEADGGYIDPYGFGITQITGAYSPETSYGQSRIFLNEGAYNLQAYNQRYLLAKHSSNGTIQRIGFLSGGKNLPLRSLNDLTGVFPRLEVNCSWQGGEWVGSCSINHYHTDPINIGKTKIFDFYDLDEVNDRYPFVQDASAEILTWTPTQQVNITLEDNARTVVSPPTVLYKTGSPGFPSHAPMIVHIYLESCHYKHQPDRRLFHRKDQN